ncbi:hypothetical protein [Streptomyces lavenduligriseus]|uniref:hypothetical protein n=1 Tax=Streptomyces lavenduligriseus TaxID=67315 RepID=UPI002018F88D|nr:hypothetical protein [Streptomyces lavenduligriseus]
MVVKYVLTEPQAVLLREIAAATSAVALPPSAIHTAWALEKRGLIKRTRRGSGHTAVVTADGRYYLERGKHPREVQAERERLANDIRQAALAPAGGAELIARLRSASGRVTVSDPAPQTRGRWRAAFYDAVHHGHVPEGHKLRWTGRQRGDCVFTLVSEETEKPAQPQPVPVIDVPDVLDRPHRLVRATRTALGRSKTVVDTRATPGVIPMHVSRAQTDRALRIMHALLTEAERRGHQVETRTGHRRGRAVQEMVVVIRGHALPLAIRERTTKVPHEPTAEETSRQQRFSRAPVPKYNHEFSGRLELGAPASSGYRTWYACGDSTRWPLEARLGHLLHSLEGCAVAAERRQQEEELRKTEQQRRWLAAVRRAREQQVEWHRAQMLVEQVTAWRRADDIRAFCRAARARGRGASLPGELEWLHWAEAYAEQLDPLRGALGAPPDPSASRQALAEFLRADPYAHPWPYDSDGRWTSPDEALTETP